VKDTLYDYIRLLNYFHISTCRWSAADLSTTTNCNIIQTQWVIRVESRVITSKSRVESESYSVWNSSWVASHQNVTRVESRVASPQLWLILLPTYVVHATIYDLEIVINNVCNKYFKSLRFCTATLTETCQKTRARFTLSDRHTGMTLSETAVQAATSGECELTLAFRCIRFVVHLTILQLY